MKTKKIIGMIILGVLCLAMPSYADVSVKKEKSSEDTLKERQSFNKLRRSTRNIYKVTMRSGVVFKLQTALGYASTIDLPEKALKVFVGDQELFKVGVYEKQVVIKPITDEMDARTNLVIETESGRLTFDVAVGAPESADFVLDFRLPESDEVLVQNAFEKRVEEKSKELESSFQAKEKKLDEKAAALSEEKLTQKMAAGISTVQLKASQAKDKVQVNLLSLSQTGDKAYLRFSILNYSQNLYRISKVVIGAESEQRKGLKIKKSGVAEFPSEAKLPSVIAPDTYEYGVLVFDWRPLTKNEKPIFRIMEDSGLERSPRNFEIRGFKWVQS